MNKFNKIISLAVLIAACNTQFATAAAVVNEKPVSRTPEVIYAEILKNIRAGKKDNSQSDDVLMQQFLKDEFGYCAKKGETTFHIRRSQAQCMKDLAPLQDILIRSLKAHMDDVIAKEAAATEAELQTAAQKLAADKAEILASIDAEYADTNIRFSERLAAAKAKLAREDAEFVSRSAALITMAAETKAALEATEAALVEAHRAALAAIKNPQVTLKDKLAKIAAAPSDVQANLYHDLLNPSAVILTVKSEATPDVTITIDIDDFPAAEVTPVPAVEASVIENTVAPEAAPEVAPAAEETSAR